MKRRNHPHALGRSVPANDSLAATSKGGRYSPAVSPVVPGVTTGIRGKALRGGKVRVGGRKLPLTLISRPKYVGVVTPGNGDEASLTERLKKLEVGEVCLIYKGGDIALHRTIRNRQRKQPTTSWFDTSKNRLILGLADKKATYEPEPILRATNDVRELAIQAVRMLGADHVKEAVEYLTAVFKTVSTGNVPDPDSANIPADAQKSGMGIADPLAAARARGRRFALEEYESPNNLALLDARDYAGRNERTINEQRQKGELYALLSPGKTRGFRYPKWQFDARPERLVCVLRPFVEAKANAWVIHSFMRRKRDEIDGKSPVEVILDEGASIAPVVDLAVRDIAGEQGAA
jgi:hypothetical protein